jgi:GT2 family glycosyltransferase
MHRSGTSLITKAIETLGIPLGDNIMPAAPDNPTGFWEDLDSYNCNKEILETLDLTWDMPTIFPLHGVNASQLDTMRQSVQKILNNKFKHCTKFAIKDPRICMLLMLWIDAAKSENIEVRFIVTIRNPLDVATSLKKRNVFDMEKGLTLWRNYNLLILKTLNECSAPRIVVDYSKFLSNTKDNIDRLAFFIHGSLPDDSQRAKISQFTQHFVDPSLCHSHTERNVLDANTNAVIGLLPLHETLEKFSSSDWSIHEVEQLLQHIDLLTCESDNYKQLRHYTREEQNRLLTAHANGLDVAKMNIYSKNIIEHSFQKLTDEIHLHAKRNDVALAQLQNTLNTKITLLQERHIDEIKQLNTEYRTNIALLKKQFSDDHHKQAQHIEELTRERSEIIKQLQKKDHEALELRQSLSWRLTAPLRVNETIQAIREWRVQSRHNVKCFPLTDIQPLDGNHWASTGEDPAFIISYRSNGKSTGWYHIEVSGEGFVSPEIYVDFGSGFSPNHCYPLEQTNGYFFLDLLISAPVHQLRLDPRHSPGEFQIQHIQIKRRSKFKMLPRTLLNIYQRERKSGKQPKQILKEKWRIAKNLGPLEALRNFDNYTPELTLLLHQEKALDYAKWISSVEAAFIQNFTNTTNSNKPHLFLVLATNVSNTYLDNTINSVLAQLQEGTHTLWILSEGRTPYRHRAEINTLNFDEKEALISNIEESEIETITLITGGWTLSPHYIAAVNHELQHTARSNFILYSDSDSIDTDGQRHSPVFKPDWCPDYLLEYDYIGGVVTTSKSVLLKSLAETSIQMSLLPWWLSALVATNQTKSTVHHLPFIGAHRSVTKIDNTQKSRQELLRALFNESIKVIKGNDSELLRIIRPVPNPTPEVTIIIPTRDRIDLLEQCIRTLDENTDYPAYKILVVDNGSIEPESKNYFSDIQKSSYIQVIEYEGIFNFSAINNFAVEHCNSELLCFLNNDIEITDREWLSELVGQLSRDGVGCVGPKLLYPNGTVQHGGVLLGFGGVAAHAFTGSSSDASGYQNRLQTTQNYSAVTAACMLTKRSLFKELGGFNERFLAVAFNDIDYCLRVREQGLQVVWTPHTHLIHHESASRLSESKRIAEFSEEIRFMKTRWGHFIQHDPAYNPHLSLNETSFEISNRWLKELNTSHPSNLSHSAEKQIYAFESNLDRVRAIIKGARGFDKPHKLQSGLSIVILNLNKPDLITPLLNSLVEAKQILSKQARIELQIIVGDTGSTDPEVWRTYQNHANSVQIEKGMKYHFSRCNNDLFERYVEYNLTLFLNNDVIFSDTPAQLRRMVETITQHTEIGVLGTRLMYPDGRLQHAGIDIFRKGDNKGLCYHPGHGQRITDTQYTLGKLETYPAVTGACLLIPSELFIRCGGFDQGYHAEAQDVDLCLKAKRLGKQAKLIELGKVLHIENATRKKGEENNQDRSRFIRKWKLFVDAVF